MTFDGANHERADGNNVEVDDPHHDDNNEEVQDLYHDNNDEVNDNQTVWKMIRTIRFDSNVTAPSFLQQRAWTCSLSFFQMTIDQTLLKSDLFFHTISFVKLHVSHSNTSFGM